MQLGRNKPTWKTMTHLKLDFDFYDKDTLYSALMKQFIVLAVKSSLYVNNFMFMQVYITEYCF